MVINAQRKYVDLLFRASNKYACFDPPIPAKVGDYGTIDPESGDFNKDGNIYEEGIAKDLGLPDPMTTAIADTYEYIVSNNGSNIDIPINASIELPGIKASLAEARYQFTESSGAMLVMTKPSISYMPATGKLSKLAQRQEWEGKVLATEAYTCTSYAMLLTGSTGGTVTVGFGPKVPIGSIPGAAASVNANLSWGSSGSISLWRQGEESGAQYYPMMKLVSLARKSWFETLRDRIWQYVWFLPFLSGPEQPAETLTETEISLPIATPPWGSLDAHGSVIQQ